MTRKIGYGKNRDRAPAERIVGWGKYRGERMADVPTQYLEWFVRNAYHQMGARQAWAEEELERRRKLDAGLPGVGQGGAQGSSPSAVDAPAQGHEADNRGESAHPKEEER